jgi:peptide/nickel transport system permease protein
MAATSASGTEFSAGLNAGFETDEELPPGLGPWRLAWRRLRRNHVALFFGGLFLLIVVMCALAPVYASAVAHTGPNVGNITGTVTVGGHPENIVSLTGIPIGPTYHSRYFFGADANGRDTAVRLLYGGRNSLEIGFIATILTMVLAMIVGIIAGYHRGIADGLISRGMDIIWAFPAVLLGVTLGTVLAVGGIGPIHGNNLFVPAFVIGIVYIPYVGKPVRAQVLQMR